MADSLKLRSAASGPVLSGGNAGDVVTQNADGSVSFLPPPPSAPPVVNVDLVLLTNDSLTGIAPRNGVVPIPEETILLAAAQTLAPSRMRYLAKVGPWAPVDTNATFLPGQLFFCKSGAPDALGNGGAGSFFQLYSGTTLAEPKVFKQYFSARDKVNHDKINSSAIFVPPPLVDDAGVPLTDPASQKANREMLNSFVATAVAAGATRVLLAYGYSYPVDQDIVMRGARGVVLEGGGCGTFTGAQGSAITRYGASAQTTVAAPFTQPGIGLPVDVTMTSGAPFRDAEGDDLAGKLVRIFDGGPYGSCYTVLATSGNVVTLLRTAANANMATGGTSPAGNLATPQDAIVDALSCFASHVRGVRLAAASPQFTGVAVSFDGQALGSDCSMCTVTLTVWQTVNFAGQLPIVESSGIGAPVVSVGGPGNGISTRLLVKVSTSGPLATARVDISTNAGLDWDQTNVPISSGSLALGGCGLGYVLAFGPGTYTAGLHQWQGGVGLGAASFFAANSCSMSDCFAAFAYEGAVFVGNSNECWNLSSVALGNDICRVEGGGFNATLKPEPGGDGHGRGGFRGTNAFGPKVFLHSGDQLLTGPWIRDINGSGVQYDGVFAIADGTAGTAASAALWLSASQNVTINGDYEFCGTVAYTLPPPAGLCQNILIGAVGFNGLRAALLAGTNYDQLTWFGDRNTVLPYAHIEHEAYAKFGVTAPTTSRALSNGPNDNVPVAAATLVLAGPSAAYSITGLVPYTPTLAADTSDGQRLLLVAKFAQSCTFVVEAAGSAPLNRITTLTGADVVLVGPFAAELIYLGAPNNRWLLLGRFN